MARLGGPGPDGGGGGLRAYLRHLELNRRGELNLHVVFTGPVAGTLTSGRLECFLFNKGDQFQVTVSGRLGGKDLTMSIEIYTGYHGPGTYRVGTTLDGSGEVRLQIGDWAASSQSNAGQLIITDSRSGVIDANLGGFEHVTGNFRCAEVKNGYTE